MSSERDDDPKAERRHDYEGDYFSNFSHQAGPHSADLAIRALWLNLEIFPVYERPEGTALEVNVSLERGDLGHSSSADGTVHCLQDRRPDVNTPLLLHCAFRQILRKTSGIDA